MNKLYETAALPNYMLNTSIVMFTCDHSVWSWQPVVWPGTVATIVHSEGKPQNVAPGWLMYTVGKVSLYPFPGILNSHELAMGERDKTESVDRGAISNSCGESIAGGSLSYSTNDYSSILTCSTFQTTITKYWCSAASYYSHTGPHLWLSSLCKSATAI